MNYFSIFYLSGLVIYLIIVIVRGIIKIDFFNTMYDENELSIDSEIKQNLYSYIELLLSHFVVWAFNINLDKENYKTEMYNNLLNTTGTFGMFLVCWILWPITICSFIGASLFSKIYKYIKKRREIK